MCVCASEGVCLRPHSRVWCFPRSTISLPHTHYPRIRMQLDRFTRCVRGTGTFLPFLSQSHTPSARTPPPHSYSSGACGLCVFVEFSRPHISHAEEWEVRISKRSRRGGRQKRLKGDDEMGWYGLFSRLRCSLLSVHAYVWYSGETRHCLRPILIGREEHIFSTLTPSFTHTHSLTINLNLLQLRQWPPSPSECRLCLPLFWKSAGTSRPSRPRTDTSKDTRWRTEK